MGHGASETGSEWRGIRLPHGVGRADHGHQLRPPCGQRRHAGVAARGAASVSGAFSFQVLVLLIITCYGGGFSCMPAYLSDLFGTKALSAIHGRILTAWGAAGVAGGDRARYRRCRTGDATPFVEL